MTQAEMLIYFKERYNLSKFANQGKLNSELYLYLNAAVNIFVKTRFTGNNPRQIAFEQDIKRRDDLRTLIKKSSALSSSATSVEVPNGKQYTFPNDFLFFVKGYCNIKIGETDRWFSCIDIPTLESYRFISTPINKPVIIEPKIFYESATTFTVLVDSDDIANLDTAIVQYIKKPNVISDSVACDLPEHTHEEIVELAVLLATEGINNLERYQTLKDHIQTIE